MIFFFNGQWRDLLLQVFWYSINFSFLFQIYLMILLTMVKLFKGVYYRNLEYYVTNLNRIGEC